MLTNIFFANSFKFRVFVHKNEVIYYSVTVKQGTACKGTLVLLEAETIYASRLHIRRIIQLREQSHAFRNKTGDLQNRE
jgi:hypothetical protein